MSTPQKDLKKLLAERRDQVLILAGAGVARATDPNPCATWNGLLEDGFARCKARCPNRGEGWDRITELLIREQRADDFIQAATRIVQELQRGHSGEYGRWLADSVGALRLKERRVIDALLGLQTRIATTNYDNLFEDAGNLQAVTWDQSSLVSQVVRHELRGILHLHGHYRMPESVVLAAKSYEDVCRDEPSRNMLRTILTLNTVVFVGCGNGIHDPNFGSLLEWSRTVLKNCFHTHFHLVRQDEESEVARQYEGLPLKTVVYGAGHADLAPFLEDISRDLKAKASRTHPFDILLVRQGDFETQRQQLEANEVLTPLERLRKGFALARSLWDAGGRRTAALYMRDLAGRPAQSLAATERIEAIQEAVDHLQQDDLHSQAMNLLEKLEELLTQLPTDSSLHERYRQLVGRSVVALGKTDLFQTVLASQLLTANDAERERLEAERAEFHLLSGDLLRAAGELVQEPGQ